MRLYERLGCAVVGQRPQAGRRIQANKRSSAFIYSVHPPTHRVCRKSNVLRAWKRVSRTDDQDHERVDWGSVTGSPTTFWPM